MDAQIAVVRVYSLIHAPCRWSHEPSIVHQDIQARLSLQKLIRCLLDGREVGEVKDERVELASALVGAVLDGFDCAVDLVG